MSTQPGHTKKRPYALYLLLFLMAFLLYANTIPHEYAWDDKIVIEKNPRVRQGISGIPDLFVKHSSQFQYDKYGYRPITLTSLAIDYSLSAGNPHFSHLMNAFYYAVLAVLIFILLSALFSSYHILFSLLATLLFITHPLHVEVVANIKSRDELLGLLFSVASLICFVHFIRQKKPAWLLGMVACYMLAYLAKENSLTLLGIYPLVFLVHKKLFTKKVLFLSAAAAVGLFIVSFIFYRYAASSQVAAHTSDGMGLYEENGMLGNSFLYVGTYSQKLADAFLILLLYLKNFMVPYPLVYYYGYNVVPATSWANPLVWVSLVVHISIMVMGILSLKKRPEILFGFLFYLVSISVFTHIVRPLSDTMADRFMFAPTLGLCVCLAGIVGWIFKVDFTAQAGTPEKFRSLLSQSIKKPYAGLLIVFSLALAYLTINRNQVWKNDLTLATHDLPYLENCSRAHYYYATLLKKQLSEDKSLSFNPQKKQQVEMEMIKQYKRSMELSDYAYQSYMELGSYYNKEMRVSDAFPIFRKGYELFPDAPDMASYLGQSYFFLGQNQLAIPLLEKGYHEAYNKIMNYYFLSLAYSKAGRYQEALVIIDKGLKKFENEKGPMYDALSTIYFDQGNLDQSVQATFQLLNYGKTPYDVYGLIISRCYARGDTAKGNKYLDEARLKGIVFR